MDFEWDRNNGKLQTLFEWSVVLTQLTWLLRMKTAKNKFYQEDDFEAIKKRKILWTCLTETMSYVYKKLQLFTSSNSSSIYYFFSEIPTCVLLNNSYDSTYTNIFKAEVLTFLIIFISSYCLCNNCIFD